jgi:hypothetical protein
MPPVREPEDPELRFRVHQPEAENMLVEMRQFTAAACSRAVPPKASDLYASAAAVKGSACKPSGNVLCRERGMSADPRHRTSPFACACHAGRADSEAR